MVMVLHLKKERLVKVEIFGTFHSEVVMFPSTLLFVHIIISFFQKDISMITLFSFHLTACSIFDIKPQGYHARCFPDEPGMHGMPRTGMAHSASQPISLKPRPPPSGGRLPQPSSSSDDVLEVGMATSATLPRGFGSKGCYTHIYFRL